MSPAEELRAAAKVLRETASNATPGPWHTVGLPWNHDTPFVVAGHPDPHVGKFVADVEQVFGDDEDDRDHAPDAAWIALASPALAEPLADFLEEAAKRRESAVAVAASVSDETETVTADDIDTLTPLALAVARAINGGTR